ncbi:protein of unknown function [Hyphomicrobium sp. 1Nfss2.1]
MGSPSRRPCPRGLDRGPMGDTWASDKGARVSGGRPERSVCRSSTPRRKLIRSNNAKLALANSYFVKSTVAAAPLRLRRRGHRERGRFP